MAQNAMSLSSESEMKHKIRLTIENFSKLPIGTKVTAPDFDLTPKSRCCIYFEKCEGCQFLYIQNKSAAEIKIQRSLVLCDCNNIKIHEERDKKIFSLLKDEDVNVFGCVNYRERFNSLTNDRLIIHLCINVLEIERKEIGIFVSDADPEKKLKEDFKSMLENPINSDVSLKVGEERIPVHWAVLCSRSPYFKRMFESEMQERVQNSVAVTDISVSTLKNLVRFLYTGDILESGKGEDMEALFDLYYAADKYEVMDLKTLCARKIINYASADNVGQILQLAHRHSDKDFKLQAMDFIRLHSDVVFQADGWKKFEADEPLTAEAFVFCLKKN